MRPCRMDHRVWWREGRCNQRVGDWTSACHAIVATTCNLHGSTSCHTMPVYCHIFVYFVHEPSKSRDPEDPGRDGRMCDWDHGCVLWSLDISADRTQRAIQGGHCSNPTKARSESTNFGCQINVGSDAWSWGWEGQVRRRHPNRLPCQRLDQVHFEPWCLASWFTLGADAWSAEAAALYRKAAWAPSNYATGK